MASSFAKRPALIAGAGGFIGLRLCRLLVEQGALVTALDLFPPPEKAPWLKHVAWVEGSIADQGCRREAVGAMARGEGRPVLFHLAGMSHAGECRDNPAKARLLNTDSVLDMAQDWLRAGNRRMVFPSSALVYAPGNGGKPLAESDPTFGASVYAQTKLEAESGLAEMALRQGLSVDVARLANVYGPGAHGDTVVSEAFATAMDKGRVSLRDPGPVLDFIHLDDVLQGLVRLALAGDEPGFRLYNLSTGVGVSIGEMAVEVARLTGTGQPRFDVNEDKGPVFATVLKNSALAERTGWKPEYSLREGLEKTYKELTSNE